MHPKDIVAVIMSVILMVLAPAYAFAIDTESGLHFDIPNGWDQTDLGKKEKDLRDGSRKITTYSWTRSD